MALTPSSYGPPTRPETSAPARPYSWTVDTSTLTGTTNATATGGTAGQDPAFLSQATFTDSNTAAVATDFTVTAANWGDTSTSFSGLTVSGRNGSFTVNGSQLYSTQGTYPFSITVSTLTGRSVVLTGSATVGLAVRVDGLEFTTTGSFTDNNGVYTTSGPVLVGLIPQSGQPFAPLASLAGTTTINSSANTFSNTGAVSTVIAGGPPTVLLSNGFPANTSISNLTGSGVVSLSGSTFTESGSAFTLNTIAFSNPGSKQS